MSKRLQSILVLSLLLCSTTFQQLPYSPNSGFDNIRIGLATLAASQQPASQPRSFTSVYSTPFSNSSVTECYVSLRSFSLAFGEPLENRVSIKGCSSTNISIAWVASQKNINIVNYIVVSGDLVGSRNFMLLSLQSQTTIFGQNNPLIDSSQLNGLNTTGQIKHFSFFQGFALQTTNLAANQTASLQRGFSVVVSQIGATSLNYSILSRGKNTYSGTVSVLLVIYNTDFFNSQNTLHLAGNTESYSNLADAALSVGFSNSASLVLTFVGVSELYANGDLVFSLQGEQSGQLSVHSNGGVNTFKLNYLVFSEQAVAPNLSDENSNFIADSQLVGAEDTSTDSSLSTIMIVVTVCCSILLLVIIFLILYCCIKQREPQAPQERIGSQNSSPVTSKQFINSQLNIAQLKNEPCNICLGKHIQVMTHCQHFFHLKCLKQWVSRVQGCPLCDDLLVKRKVTVFCRNCCKGYVFRLDQTKQLDPDLGIDKKCSNCQQKKNNNQMMSDKSQEFWIKYAIDKNEEGR